jgi:hypothetical protein
VRFTPPEMVGVPNSTGERVLPEQPDVTGEVVTLEVERGRRSGRVGVGLAEFRGRAREGLALPSGERVGEVASGHGAASLVPVVGGLGLHTEGLQRPQVVPVGRLAHDQPVGAVLLEGLPDRAQFGAGGG